MLKILCSESSEKPLKKDFNLGIDIQICILKRITQSSAQKMDWRESKSRCGQPN